MNNSVAVAAGSSILRNEDEAELTEPSILILILIIK